MRTLIQIRLYFWFIAFAFSVGYCGFSSGAPPGVHAEAPETTAEEKTQTQQISLKESAMAFKISSDFAAGEKIGSKYTCEGENISPPLSWTEPPEGTKSLALIVDDPDAPDPAAPKMTWVHWVVYDMPPDRREIPAGVSPEAKLPGGGVHGITDFKRYGYGGPCPPIGEHRYYFKLYALDRIFDLPEGQTKTELLARMEGHVLGETTLMGRYQKRK